VFGLEIIGR